MDYPEHNLVIPRSLLTEETPRLSNLCMRDATRDDVFQVCPSPVELRRNSWSSLERFSGPLISAIILARRTGKLDLSCRLQSTAHRV